MADRVTVKVDLHGLEEDLLTLAPRIAKRLFRRALRAVGEAWAEMAKSHVPVGNPLTAHKKDYNPGALRDSIGYQIKTSSKSDTGTVQVGPMYDSKGQAEGSNNTSQSPGVYGMFVEFGLKTTTYPKQPFMRPTFDVSAERIIQLFADNLRDDLEAAVKK